MKAGVSVRRTVGHSRGRRGIRRRSAGLSQTRAGAALAAVLSAIALYGLVASPLFAFRHLAIEGNSLTAEVDLAAQLGVEQGANLFQLTTRPITERLAGLPTVDSADVSVRLPDTLAIQLHERQPIMVWQVASGRFLLDAHGFVFAAVADGSRGAAAGLPIIDDRRAASAGLAVGQWLSPIDLDAATRLGALKPSQLGSAASSLAFSVDDIDGYVVSAQPSAWTAVFGFYTPTMRRTDLIPGQVRLLGSLLAKAGESKVARVILATDRDGTYVPRATPRSSASPKP
jgi:hypothetical protein